MPLRAHSMPSNLKLCLLSPTIRRCSRSPRVPMEIIDQILEFALIQPPSTPDAHDFSSVAAFSLASSTFRQLALRRFFRELTVINHAQWTGLFTLLQAQENPIGRPKCVCFTWVKSLYASSTILMHKPIRLSFLSNLRSLSIDMSQEGLSTQHPLLTRLFGYLEPLNACPNMTSLALTGLSRIDALLLKVIAKKFPCLTDLYLSCTERVEFGCCWSCFEDSLTCVIHSPIPEDYRDVMGMATDYADSLRPLTHLAHLHLGVFLSDEYFLPLYISHSLENGEHSRKIDNWIPCQGCLTKALDDVRQRELVASIIIGQKLRELRTVGWSSLFANVNGYDNVNQHAGSDDTVEDGAEMPQSERGNVDASTEKVDTTGDDTSKAVADDRLKTTVWISRDEARIRVRRVPW